MSLWTWIFGSKIADEAAPAPQPAENWQPQHGPWEVTHVCHCGYIPKQDGWWASSVAPEICPECGCEGGFKSMIGRKEWEEDISPQHVPLYRANFITVPTRNHRWVPKPEGCQKETV